MTVTADKAQGAWIPRRFLIVCAVGIASMGWALHCPAPARAADADVDVHEAVLDAVTRGIPTRVIVELRLPAGPAAPEGHLGSLAALLAQRADIDTTQGQLLARLRNRRHRMLHRYQTVPYIALEVEADSLAELQASPLHVRRVVEDTLKAPMLADSVPLIEGDQAWSVGYDGTGVVVAILDTGVDRTHPFLAGKVVDEACFSSAMGGSVSLCPGGTSPKLGPGAAAPCNIGGCNHGTHVAGIAAGNGDGAGQTFSGVAKGAQIMAVQVFSRFNSFQDCGGVPPCALAWTSDIMAGLDHVLQLRTQYNISSVNLSLGGGLFAANCDTEPEKAIIDSLRSVGIATVIAAGNDGSRNMLSSPGCISTAISVGSTTKSEVVSSFSNAASFLSLFAPGESINSSVPGGGYAVFSGTSMATPHVTGALAILKEAAPAATVDDLLGAIQLTGPQIQDTRSGGTVTKPGVRILHALQTLTATTNPVPVLSSLQPASVTAGGSGFTLTVNGSDFVFSSTIQWNGVNRATSVVSSSRLTTTILASEIASTGTAQVRVVTPSPGGGASVSLPLAINNPLPALSTLQPSSAPAGGQGFTLTVFGSGFVPGSVVQWNGTNRQTGFAGSGQLTATILAADVATAGSASVRVVNPAPGGGTSGSLPFTIGSLAPVLGSLQPTSVTAGAAGFVLTVNGSNFAPTSVIQWNGVNRSTTYGGSGQLTTSILASEVASGASVAVTVTTPGAGTSGSATFTINNPAPVLGSLQPSSVAAGAAGFTLTVNGSSFVPTSKIRWNGVERSTTFNGSGQLTTSVLASEVATGAGVAVTVVSPQPGGGTSTSSTLTVTNPAPVMGSLQPSSITAGAAGFTLTINGASFVSTSVVRWNGANRTTTFVNSGQLTAAILASEVAAAANVSITVLSPQPGGGTSASAPLTIANPSPVLGSLQPSGVTAGVAGFTLTISGSSFVSTSVVRWNGEDRPTTFNGSGQLTAAIPASDVTTAGTAQVSVVTPAPGGGVSTNLPFTIPAPVPCPASIVVDNLAPGATSAQVTFTGTWKTAATAGFFGANKSLVSNSPGIDTYTWSTPVFSPGLTCTYQVQVRWTSTVNRSKTVPYTVSGHTGGPSTKTFNQRLAGGQWKLHGTYTFPAGSLGTVTVSDQNGQASADAVRFVLVP